MNQKHSPLFSQQKCSTWQFRNCNWNWPALFCFGWACHCLLVNTNSVKQLYLWILENIESDGFILSYLIQASHSYGRDQSWTFPEEGKVLQTSYEKVLASKVKDKYSGSVLSVDTLQKIRCQSTFTNESLDSTVIQVCSLHMYYFNHK